MTIGTTTAVTNTIANNIEATNVLADQVTDENVARMLVFHLASKYGFSIAMRRRADVEFDYDRPLSDEEWDQIKNSDPWQNAWWVNEDYSFGEFMNDWRAEGEFPPVIPEFEGEDLPDDF